MSEGSLNCFHQRVWSMHGCAFSINCQENLKCFHYSLLIFVKTLLKGQTFNNMLNHVSFLLTPHAEQTVLNVEFVLNILLQDQYCGS